uniref:KIB1-4 beta-propeller domain-containing protein n=1 Tax=Oryza rufipogon TaxID=4529 RepID=A0A0E0Q4R4_ORYRU
MMFPEGFGRFPGHRALAGHARFLDLSASAAAALIRVPLPFLRDHCVLDSPDGLLLLQRDGDTAIRLLHPFTGDIAEFPPPRFPRPPAPPPGLRPHRRSDIRKICAAVDVADEGIVTVMLAVEKIGRVAFAAAGDDDWVISTWKENQLDNALSFQGGSCMWDGLIHASVIDPPRRRRREGEESVAQPPVPPPRRIVTCSSEEIHLPSLVELDSELMLVGYNGSSLSRILVLRLADLAMGMIVPVANIGDHVLFIGARSLCVSPGWLPSIRGNSIVCFHAGENYLAQYHLGTGSWSPASDGQLMLSPPSRPCSLIHHIFTCCYRQFWNKGLIFCSESEPEWWAMRKYRYGDSTRQGFHPRLSQTAPPQNPRRVAGTFVEGHRCRACKTSSSDSTSTANPAARPETTSHPGTQLQETNGAADDQRTGCRNNSARHPYRTTELPGIDWKQLSLRREEHLRRGERPPHRQRAPEEQLLKKGRTGSGGLEGREMEAPSPSPAKAAVGRQPGQDHAAAGARARSARAPLDNRTSRRQPESRRQPGSVVADETAPELLRPRAPASTKTVAGRAETRRHAAVVTPARSGEATGSGDALDGAAQSPTAAPPSPQGAPPPRRRRDLAVPPPRPRRPAAIVATPAPGRDGAEGDGPAAAIPARRPALPATSSSGGEAGRREEEGRRWLGFRPRAAARGRCEGRVLPPPIISF